MRVSFLALKEFTAARQAFEETILRFPRAVRPRVLLTHVLLQEGRDFEAIEAAFKEALQVDPNNPGLKHNWAVFQKENRRSPASGSTQR